LAQDALRADGLHQNADPKSEHGQAPVRHFGPGMARSTKILRLKLADLARINARTITHLTSRSDKGDSRFN
jgi:hypothetical protein